ncbi:hypothetical protein [Actinomadura rudentiformis]|uniref:Uncharacterized protein n=1 Tax=Actinomadura rudentiformis TaxID=359158 RepID=A0A6H9YUG4_9ACTN|nr:hypothetical protein [Actinomadura rudentiformis]KAB2345920.1 hypothetical protein F8566_24675 [Actinomadura rudentiformis]
MAWVRLELPGEWRAIVTWMKQEGDAPPEQMLVDVRAKSVQQLAAFANVKRLQLHADGTGPAVGTATAGRAVSAWPFVRQSPEGRDEL